MLTRGLVLIWKVLVSPILQDGTWTPFGISDFTPLRDSSIASYHDAIAGIYMKHLFVIKTLVFHLKPMLGQLKVCRVTHKIELGGPNGTPSLP